MIFYITFVYIIILNLQNNRSLNILVLNIFLLSCLCYYFFTYSFIKRGEKKDRNNMVVSIRNTQIRSQNDEISLLPCKICLKNTKHLLFRYISSIAFDLSRATRELHYIVQLLSYPRYVK